MLRSAPYAFKTASTIAITVNSPTPPLTFFFYFFASIGIGYSLCPYYKLNPNLLNAHFSKRIEKVVVMTTARPD